MIKYPSLILICISMIFTTMQGNASLDTTQVNFVDSLPDDGNLVLGVFADGEMGTHGKNIDASSQGGLSHAIKAADFAAKVSTTKIITAPMKSGYDQILLVGLGDMAEAKTSLAWQEIGGNAVQQAVSAFKAAPPLVFDVTESTDSNHAIAHLAYGAKLGSYYFDQYYTHADRKKSQESLTLVSNNVEASKQYYMSELEPLANAIWITRNLSNEPANVIYPESFVAQWRKHFKGMKNIKIKVYDEKDMVKNGMGAIYGVGKGSQRPPRMMVVEYMAGDSGDAPVVLVGKGITFDTGGISLKKPTNMWNMKFDMSGAASSIATIYALAGRGAKVNAVGIAALAENMPGPNAQRPGDVVTSMSGKTIQIRSTDAEGRLVLADGVYYGDTMYNPALLVDLATLTGSVGRALGKDYAGIFTRHDELVADFITAGQQTGDKVWQLPLNDKHFKAIENKVADVMNSGPDAPGASAGAAFIGTFIRETTPWIHLDIAGVAWSDKTAPMKASYGSTSFGVQLMNTYIKTHFENN